MRYGFKCKKHGAFEVEQSIHENHKAICPECGEPAQRIYSTFEWIWADSLYRSDGSRRQDKDYAPVMKG